MTDIFEFDDRNHAERFVGTLHDPAATVGDVLTVQADKSIAAAPGGGGSGGVQTVTVPVSSAQILDLFNTPVVIVPGTPGFVTVLQGDAVAFLEGTTPYTDHGGILGLRQGSDVDAINSVLALLCQGNDQFSCSGFGPQLDNSLATYNGVDVELIVDTASPTLGDGTLLVTLSYFLAPTV